MRSSITITIRSAAGHPPPPTLKQVDTEFQMGPEERGSGRISIEFGQLLLLGRHATELFGGWRRWIWA